MPARKLHVLVRKEDLDPARIADKVLIVIDTLFATTTIVNALSHGAREIVPALDRDEALRIAQHSAADSLPVLAGELNGIALAGFSHPTPQALASAGIRGRRVVYSTTNGTRALRSAQGARAVFAGCLRNARAAMDAALSEPGSPTILLLCAGSAGAINVEDFYTAGILAARFLEATPDALVTDSALAALACSRADPVSTLATSRVGRMYFAQWGHEIEFAAQIDSDRTVARFEGGAVVAQ